MARMEVMTDWSVELVESAVDDFRALGRAEGRALLEAAISLLSADPLADTRNMKTLRPNPVARRELRLLGKYRVLFNVERRPKLVTIVLAGEKRGNQLIVRGRRFTGHESGTTK
jgi:hypothetical protein